MCTFNRNNRVCIHLLQPDNKFIDFTEEEDYYLCNDELNSAGIEQGDLVKFRILNDDSKTTQRIYGFIQYIENINHTTFMICEHYDEDGEKFYLDYVYSSFHHAFRRLNHHGSFSDWNQLTHIKFAHAPEWFVKEWIDEHVTTEETAEEFEGVTEGTEDIMNDVQENSGQEILPDDVLALKEQLDLAGMLFDMRQRIDTLNSKINNKTVEISNMLSAMVRKLKEYIEENEEKQKQFVDRINELSNRLDIVGKTASQTYVKQHVIC